jgi:hypothetical protein
MTEVKIPSSKLLQLQTHEIPKKIIQETIAYGKSLKRLDLKGVGRLSDQDLRKIFSNCPNIEVVDLRYTTFRLEYLISFLPSSVRCVRLDHIEIDCRNSNEEISSIWNREREGAQFLGHEVQSISTDDSRFWSLLTTNDLRHIRKLKISSIEPDSLTFITKHNFDCLKNVDFYCQNWSARHVSIVANWSKMANLKYLTLRFFRISKGLNSLWQLSKNYPQESCFVRCNGIQ